MSLYSDYLNEIGNKEIVEHDYGFATYLISGAECYVDDIYVRPEDRKTKKGLELANELTTIAKGRGCTYLLGTVNMRIKDPTSSVKNLLSYGFKLVKSSETMLMFTKELQ